MYKSSKEYSKEYTHTKHIKLPQPKFPPYFEQGSHKVVTLAADDDGVLYAKGMPTSSTMVATSCLVQPMEGDRVYVVVDDGKLVITDILSRQKPQSVMTLNTQRANLRIVAPEIELHGKNRLKIHSPNLTILSRTSRWVTETLHQISQRLFVSSKHASRKVEQTDETRAKHIVQDAQHSLVITSEIGSLKSSAVLKIDGGQVHVG